MISFLLKLSSPKIQMNFPSILSVRLKVLTVPCLAVHGRTDFVIAKFHSSYKISTPFSLPLSLYIYGVRDESVWNNPSHEPNGEANMTNLHCWQLTIRVDRLMLYGTLTWPASTAVYSWSQLNNERISILDGAWRFLLLIRGLSSTEVLSFNCNCAKVSLQARCETDNGQARVWRAFTRASINADEWRMSLTGIKQYCANIWRV